MIDGVFLLKVNIVFTLFFVFYYVFLRRFTFHQLNRIWLLLIVPLSLLIPKLNILPNNLRLTINDNFDFNEELTPIYFSPDAEAVSESIFSNVTLAHILLLVYLIGVLFSLIKSGMGIYQLIQLKKKHQVQKDGKFTFVLMEDDFAAFSFFNNIFIPHRFLEQKKYLPVIEHEKLHASQKHSLDLIFVELFRAIIWFNPLVYLYQKWLKVVHEYYVDNTLSNQASFESDYVDLLLDRILINKEMSVVNGFKSSMLKKRIIMMTVSQSNRYKKWMYMGALPIIAILLFAFHDGGNIESDVPSILPIPSFKKEQVTSGFGMRKHPITKELKMHTGIDFKAKIGTPVVATANGVVIKREFSKKGYGNVIVVQHGDRYQTVYAQLSAFEVELGAVVKKGDRIALTGNSGKSTGPHLHYEVIEDGKKVNPSFFLK